MLQAPVGRICHRCRWSEEAPCGVPVDVRLEGWTGPPPHRLGRQGGACSCPQRLSQQGTNRGHVGGTPWQPAARGKVRLSEEA